MGTAYRQTRQGAAPPSAIPQGPPRQGRLRCVIQLSSRARAHDSPGTCIDGTATFLHPAGAPLIKGGSFTSLPFESANVPKHPLPLACSIPQ